MVKTIEDKITVQHSQIGSNTVFSTQAFVKEQDVPDNVIVFGKFPDLVFKDIDKFDLTLFKVFDI